MKKISFSIIIILTAFIAQAQQYIPFPTQGDSAVWRTLYYGRGRPTSIEYWVNYSFIFEKDTVSEGKTYHKLKNYNVFYNRDNGGPIRASLNEDEFNFGFREENKRIYITEFNNYSEYVLYDFNLKAGDTLKRKKGSYNEAIYILSVDSIKLNDNTFRRYYTESEDNKEVSNIVVEGIGGIRHSFVGELECFSLGETQIYKRFDYGKCGIARDYNPNIDKYKGVVGMENTGSDKVSFKVFPNPSTGQFTIQTQSIFSESYICVRDVLGRIVHSERLQFPNQTINISNQPKGLYFVELYFNGEKSIQKVIVQ